MTPRIFVYGCFLQKRKTKQLLYFQYKKTTATSFWRLRRNNFLISCHKIYLDFKFNQIFFMQ